jgi:hypothetical protein
MNMKINYLIFFLLAVALLSFSNSALASGTRLQVKIVPPKKEKTEEVIPRIDDEAASIVREDKNIVGASKTDGAFSQNFWVFLFGVYLFLLIFNLSANFGKEKKLQWFWISVFTFLAVWAWDNLDISRNNDWFPAVVMESGIIIYIFYLYYRPLPKRE